SAGRILPVLRLLCGLDAAVLSLAAWGGLPEAVSRSAAAAAASGPSAITVDFCLGHTVFPQLSRSAPAGAATVAGLQMPAGAARCTVCADLGSALSERDRAACGQH